MKIRTTNSIISILKIVVTLSVASQIQIISRYLRPVMFIGWGILAVVGIIYQHGSIRISKATKVYFVLYLALFLFCALMELFNNTGYFEGAYFRALLIPLAVVITAEANARDIDIDSFNSIIKCYIIAATIYALYVNITYFPSLSSWLNQVRYIFDDKNSAAQIWSTASLLSIFIGSNSNEKRAWVWKFVAGYLIVVIALSQCRTAILGLAIVYIFFIVFYAKKKAPHIALLIIAPIIALNIPRIYAYIYKIFFISNSYTLNVNTFSSGRIAIYQDALTVIKNNFWVGIGNYYVDCSYLMILCETGLVGFVLIEAIWLSRITQNVRIRTKDNFQRMVSLITIYYIVSSALEGLPPFGPGVAAFMFWIVGGYQTGRESNKEHSFEY